LQVDGRDARVEDTYNHRRVDVSGLDVVADVGLEALVAGAAWPLPEVGAAAVDGVDVGLGQGVVHDPADGWLLHDHSLL